MRRRNFTALIATAILAVATLSPTAAADVLQRDDITRRERYGPETTAEVDTTLREIRLPRAGSGGTAGLLDSRPLGMDVVTVNGDQAQSFSFDGQGMRPNGTLSPPASGLTPLGVAAQANGTDVVVLTPTEATWYSFDGDAQRSNPFLSVGGLVAPLQVGVRPDSYDLFALDSSALRAFSTNGSGRVPNPALSISGLSSPLAFALHPRTFDVMILEGAEARYYAWNGAELAQNPFLSIGGLTNPVAARLADGTAFILEASGVRAYNLDGTQFRYNAAFSIAEAAGGLSLAVLGDGSMIAVRFETEIRFYLWNGAAMVENLALRITGLAPPPAGGTLGGYTLSAIAVSQLLPIVGDRVDALMLRANEAVPAHTAIRYEVSADSGATWLPAPLGKAVPIQPSSPTEVTWGAVWRATLTTTNAGVTPKVLPDIQVDQLWRPDKPAGLTVIPLDPDGLVRSVTPTLRWQFSDRDQEQPEGDWQTAFQLQIFDRDSGQLIYNTGKISGLTDAAPPPDEGGGTPLTAPDSRGLQSEFTLPLGAFPIGHRFTWRVRVWDQYELVSEWSEQQPIEVLAIYNLLVTDIVRSPDNPPPVLPTALLPVNVKAGARFSFSVDSIGPLESVSVLFTDNGSRIMWPRSPAGELQNTWDGSYFTAPDLPTDTIVRAVITGYTADGRSTSLEGDLIRIKGSIHDDFWIFLSEPREER